ncbi:DUF6498-containing protein [Terricaulis sp.]|uniref:DUF6498-containing protein n=1 Tax=Terricaulis sp. TaxID=2768686 RepID=UPI0037849513
MQERANGQEVPPTLARRWPMIAAIMLNAVPIIGVLFWGWSAFALIFLYWLENIVVGVRTLVSMLLSAAASGGGGVGPSLFFAAFFCVHYGLFCFGHGVFVVLVFGVAQHTAVAPGGNWLDLFGVASGLFHTQANLFGGFVSVVLWQALVLTLFILNGDFRRATPQELMGAPYPRIMTLHVVIIAGGFLLLALNQPLWGLVLLALIKSGYDVAAVMGRAEKREATRAHGAVSPEA